MSSYAPSCRVLLGLLKSPTIHTQVTALKRLNNAVSFSWFELADQLSIIENYYEVSSGENKQLAALLLSHIHFHLEQLDFAMRYSLLAGDAFLTLFQKLYGQHCPEYPDGSPVRQFVDVIIGAVVDNFIDRCSRSWEVTAGLRSADDVGEDDGLFPQVERFVTAIVGASHGGVKPLSTQALKMLLGIAIDAYKIDLVKQILRPGQEASFTLIKYVVENANLLVSTKHFRKAVYKVVADLYEEHFSFILALSALDETELLSRMADSDLALNNFEELPRYCEVLFYLDDADSVATLLKALVNASLIANDNQKKHYLWALQLSFDLTSFGSQSFLMRIRNNLRGVQADESSSEIKEKSTDAMAEDASRPKLKTIEQVLLGDSEISIGLKFSHLQNGTDLEIADAVRNGLDSKHNVLHTSLIVAHGLMQRGTTCDVFLRKNLDWFGRSVCWGKFTATASLGVVHQTHAEKSFRVLSTYLPGIASNNQQEQSSSFSDGGSLYALGLIHANRSDANVVKYLLEQLSVGSGMAGGRMSTAGSTSSTVNEISQHGASLGLGLAAMGSQNSALYDALRSVLMMDSAVSGESSALGIGLIMLGSGSAEVVEDLLQYAKDTRHEKIIRACSLAVALVCFKCEEEALDVCNRMMTDPDPLIRYGGCFALGLAHCATGRESAIRSLLHVAVSDTSNDVRRAAVLSISYVVCNMPEQTPRVLKLLSDSFNFHVRYAATLAIGISCAGTGSAEALGSLVPATRDTSDIVKQAAFISIGLVLMECTDKQLEDLAAKSEDTVKVNKAKSEKEKMHKTKEATTERARQHAKNVGQGLPPIPTPSQVREHLIQVSTDRREDVMARVGAIIGLGLLEAGGRNVTSSFFSNRNLLRREAVVGFMLFSQYWFWYPLLLTVSMTMRPTALIGLTADLKCPKGFDLQCDEPQSKFAYPKKYQPKKKEQQTQGVFALLSAAQRRTGAKPQSAHIETREEPTDKMDEDESIEEVPEEPTHTISNMSRMLPGQCTKVRLPENGRYVPICPERERRDGIVVLMDNHPEEPESYFEATSPPVIDKPATKPQEENDEDEAPVPEPFELD